MLQDCHERKLVVPSFESLTYGPMYPKGHLIFYSICLKSVVGGPTWKQCLRKEGEELDGFGTPTDYAFAYIILENNYESWVRRGREALFDFVTEYEDEGCGKRSLYTERASRFEYDIKAANFLTYSIEPDQGVDFKAARKARRALCAKIYKEIKGKLVLPTLEEVRDGKNESTPTKRKREKEARPVKKYTKGGSGRKRYGGWSDEAHVQMEAVATQLKEDRQQGIYKFFDQAVHQWQRIIMDMEESDEEGSDTEKHTVNRSAAWDL